ncbi:uncharacterized protein LOC107369057 [Tetranychus urticae]|uniref:Uncharacterized protein n=1 Tax=Tetranychus urticae TaxID=32264 RepID=T1L0H4_TETUR|nr:uncharacterized protein LOC107369057 [Tetranychus urticae]
MLSRTLIGIGFAALVGVTITICVLVPIFKRSSSSWSFNEDESEPEWVAFKDNVSLTNAYVAGYQTNDDPVFICRADYEHYAGVYIGIFPGTLDPRKRVCLISYGGNSYEMTTFEFLKAKDESKLTWVTSSKGDLPMGTLIAGSSDVTDELPIAKFYHKNQILIGKVEARDELAYASYDDTEVEAIEYEVLCLTNFSFKK